jgi:DNA-binding beta-propeller fold protein YncE
MLMIKTLSRDFCFSSFSRKVAAGWIIVLILILEGAGVQAQSPTVSYASPQVFLRNSAISNLSPTATNVPALTFQNVSTFAGTGTSGVTNASTAATSTFDDIKSVVMDRHGNTYVAEFSEGRIRKIAANGGAVTTLKDWSSFQPQAIAINSSNGDLYISIATHRILKVPNANSTNYATQAPNYSDWSDATIVWLGTSTNNTTDGIGTTARFNTPTGIFVDANNEFLYVADYNNSRIRKVTISTGAVTTVMSGSTVVAITNPEDLVVDGSGNIFVTSGNTNKVHKITSSGTLSDFSGSGTAGFQDGTAAIARFNDPRGIDMDGAGNFYVADGSSTHAIRKITPSGDVSTLAGSGTGVGGSITNGVGTAARFNLPWDVFLDRTNSLLYVADFNAHRIQKVEIGGYTVSPSLPTGLSLAPTTGVISGTPTTLTAAADYVVTAYNATGSASSTLNINVADLPTITTTTAVSSITTSSASSGGTGINDGGSPVTAKGVVWGTTSSPTVALSTKTNDGTGTGSFTSSLSGLTDGMTYYLRSYVTTAIGTSYGSELSFTTLQVAPNISYASPTYTLAKGSAITTPLTLNNTGGTPDKVLVSTLIGSQNNSSLITGLALDGSGHVYIVASTGHKILKLNLSTGVTTTLAGAGPGHQDGPLSSALFNFPFDVHVESDGRILVVDGFNNAIRRIDLSASTVSTVAGNNGKGSLNGAVGTAQFFNPQGVVTDASGNIYVSDANNNRVRKISGGVVSTFSGPVTDEALSGHVDGSASTARFFVSAGIAYDASTETFYITETGNHSIRKITGDGVVSTFAGADPNIAANSKSGFINGTGTAARFAAPSGMKLDGRGNLLVADRINNAIRKVVLSTGVVSTMAFGNGATSNNGHVSTAGAYGPSDIDMDADGNFYVAERTGKQLRIISGYSISPALPTGLYFDPRNGTISGTPTTAQAAKAYKVSSQNTMGTSVTTITLAIAAAPTVATTAATNMTRSGATINGTVNANGGTTSALTFTYSTNADLSGGTTINTSPTSASGNTVTRVSAVISSGLSDNTTYYFRISATNLAGGPINGSIISFITLDAPPSISYSGSPFSLSLESAPVTFSPVNTGGSAEPMQVGTMAGQSAAGHTDGLGGSAKFNRPAGLAVDGSGNVYVADYLNHRIRKITSTGVVTTFAGPAAGVSVAHGTLDGTGSTARFNAPQDLVFDATGNLYVSDTDNHLLRKITPAGVVTTIAGSGTSSFQDGSGSSAHFRFPRGLVVNSSGNIFMADYANNRIRMITPSGVVTTFAGRGSSSGVNGNGTLAGFSNPLGLAIDGSGVLYVSEYGGHRIRKINPSADVTTLAGSGEKASMVGTGTGASFNSPSGLAVDGDGNIYVVENHGNLIRKVTPSGVVSTQAGSGATKFADGVGTAASFSNPIAVAIDADGNLYVTDAHRIRKISKYSLSPALPAGLSFNTTTGVISGTPTALSSTTTYTVTASNGGGTSTANFILSVSSSLLTADVTSIGATTATTGGTVDVSYTDITARGVVWSTSTGPTTELSTKTNDGTSTGIFSSNIIGLTQNTTYYVRSYVIYNGGASTEYGSEKLFTTNRTMSMTPVTKTFGDPAFFLTAPISNGTGAWTFTSGTTAVATTSSNTLTIAGAGGSTITATQAAVAPYASATASFLLTVNGQVPTINLGIPTTTLLKDANGLVITPASNSGGTVTLSLGAGSTTASLTGSPGNYSLSAVNSTGDLIFEASVLATGNYAAGTLTRTMSVTKNNPTITFTLSASTVTYANGLTQSLTATGGGSTAPVTFSVVSGPGTTNGSNGSTLNINGPGDIVIKAAQAGDDNHNPAPDVVRTLTVNPAAPVITGFTPTSATEGEVVTITGSNFQNVTGVSFGGTAAASFAVTSATTITAVLATGHTGVVSVTTASGTDTEPGFRYKALWTGSTNAFNSTGNWSGGRVPQTDDDIIFSPTAASDLELDGNKTVGHVNFNGSGRALKLGAHNLTIKGNLTMPGNISGTGRVIMNGGSLQTITGSGDIPDLEISNANGVTIDASGDELTVSGTLRSTSGTLSTNGKLRLTSSSSGTARVGAVAGSITGNVIAERYVQRNENSDGTGRAWRLVSVPVTGTGTLQHFFMNGRSGQDLTLSTSRDAETDNSGTPIVGHNYATALEATTAGFDWIGVANSVSSLRYYTGDAGGGSFASEQVPTMTTSYAAANQGYMVFTRGDRKLDFPSATSSGSTTFRSTGSLKTGNQTVSIAPASTSKFTLVGNPYMSVLDLSALYASNTTVIEPSFWIWDANMAGTNKQGGYVNVYKSGTQWVTNTGSYIDPQLIESGMAFFVEPASALSTATDLTIMESHKSTASSAGLSPFATDQADDHGRLYVRMERADEKGQRQLIDGVMADFHTSFKTSLGDVSDREKLRNGISRGALWLSTDKKILSSEGLPWPKADRRSIPLYMSGVGDQTLLVRIDPRGMRDRYVTAWLKDNVLNRQVEINMSTPTDYDFIGTGSASWDSTRFEIVYVEAGRPATGMTLDPDDAAEQPNVKLYPNPSKTAEVKLSLRAFAPGSYTIQVLDMTGRLVATAALNHRSMNGEYRILEGRRLTPGTYIIRLSDQHKQLKETLRLMVD